MLDRNPVSRLLATLVSAAILVVAASCGAPATPESSSTDTPTLQAERLLCVYYRGEVRRRYPGYDHIVHLHNACQSAVVCDVSSDVDPKAVRVRLAPAEQKAVLLRRGSPSRQFTPRVSCEVARAS